MKKGTGRGWIGIVAKRDDKGRLAVVQIAPQGPAASKGLMTGDFITMLNGISVKSEEEFDSAIAYCEPGSQIRLSYIRGAWQVEVTLTVARE